MLTWRDVEEAALHDTVLHAAVTLERTGTLTREEALIEAVLLLSKIRADQHEQLVRYMMLAPVKMQ